MRFPPESARYKIDAQADSQLAKVPHGRRKTLTFVAALRWDGLAAPCVIENTRQSGGRSEGSRPRLYLACEENGGRLATAAVPDLAGDQRPNTYSIDVFCMSFSAGVFDITPCAMVFPPISTATYCLPFAA
jgi:hypothetical protein